MIKSLFIETDKGLELLDGPPPSSKAFEQMGRDLACRLDNIQFKLGDWAVLAQKHLGYTAYEAIAVKVGLSPQTIETQWAYTCRNVPVWVRNNLPFSYHREVARVRDPLDQKELLNYALQQKTSGPYNIQQFRENVALFLGQPIPPPPVSGNGTTFERDLAFELTEQIHQLENQVEQERERANQAETALISLRERVEGLCQMKPTELMQNIQRVVEVLREVLEALRGLGVDK